MNTFQQHMATPTSCYEMEVASLFFFLFNIWLISVVNKWYLDCEKAVRDNKCSVKMILLLKTYQK